MTNSVSDRLRQNGIVIPTPPAPAANYVPYVTSGNLVFIAGQIPLLDGKVAYTGKVGVDHSVEQGAAIARICGMNILAQVNAALDGDLARVRRCVKLGGFVNCEADFTDHPEVINGASDLMVEVFAEAGRHARFAVGANALPRNVPVEIDAIFEIA